MECVPWKCAIMLEVYGQLHIMGELWKVGELAGEGFVMNETKWIHTFFSIFLPISYICLKWSINAATQKTFICVGLSPSTAWLMDLIRELVLLLSNVRWQNVMISWNIMKNITRSQNSHRLSSSDEHGYSNILIKWPSNIICIRIRAISPVQIYSDIHS